MAGRITLIKSALRNLPIYHMSIFKIPKTVSKRLETILKNLLWGHDYEKRKIHWIGWDKAIRSIEDGGLGLDTILNMNEALLVKWWWSFTQNNSSLWKEVIYKKFGVNSDSWLHVNVKYKNIYSWWNAITNVSKWQNNNGDLLINGLKVKIGNGEKTSFWNDNWTGKGCLSKRYPRLFSITIDKETSVRNAWKVDVNENNWNIMMRRNLFTWEQEMFEKMKEELKDLRININADDSIIWEYDSKGIFSVKSFKKVIYNEANNDSFFPWKNIWSNAAPNKCKVFVWKFYYGGIACKMELCRRGIVVDDKLCPMCKEKEESIDHLFIHCRWTNQIWNECLEWWNVNWAITKNIKVIINSWKIKNIGHHADNLWNTMLITSLWSTWKARNDATFNNTQPKWMDIVKLIKFRVTKWVKKSVKSNPYQINDITYNLDGIRKI